ncbi:MAG TPA: hypothetical protein VGB72_00950 [Acidobacteriota bacterium]
MEVDQKKAGPVPGLQSPANLYDRVRDLLGQLAKTISSIKIFSISHESSKKLIRGLWQNMSGFLDIHPKLELAVEEFSFLFQNRVVYKDEKAIKSLPFLFYRDGMTKLFFHRSLKQEELVEFLRAVRTSFEMPAEFCDVVSLLWEKDLPNIRCLAPDAFLEAKIGAGTETSRPRTQYREIVSGVIDLPAGERTEGEVPAFKLSFGSQVEEPLNGDGPARPDGDQEEIYTFLSEQEDRRLGEMLQDNRKVSPLGEMVQLISEILHLERMPERFGNTMKVAFHLQQDLVQKTEFSLLVQLLTGIQELRTDFPEPNSPQHLAADNFLQQIKDPDALALLKKSVAENRLVLSQPFFDYLRLLGPDSLSLVGELYELERNPSFRSNISSFLLDIGRQAPHLLFRLVSPQQLNLSRDIIGVLGSIADRRVVPLLGQFRGDWPKPLKLEAIRALGRFRNPEAGRELFGFLDDPDEEVRVIAVNNVRVLTDSALILSLEPLVGDKRFDSITLAERQSILDLLGRSRLPKAYDLLRRLLKKRLGLFRRTEKVSTRLCVIQALERFPSPHAKEILEKGARMRYRVLRLACRSALARLKFPEGPTGINPPEAP